MSCLRTQTLVLVLSLVLGLPAAAHAAGGDLDPSFDGDGRVLTDFGAGEDEARDAVVDDAGRIVVAGSGGIADTARPGTTAFALARYLPDGTLDPSFGEGGRVQTDFGSINQTAGSVAIDAQGRIVAVGSSFAFDGIGASFALARYLPSGTLDPSFGEGGKVITRLGLSGGREAVIDGQGRIVVVGMSQGRGGNVTTVLRYLPDGTLDPAFSGDGTRRIRNGQRLTYGSVALDADGRIVLAGGTHRPHGAGSRLTVLRLLDSGLNDRSFGHNSRAHPMPRADASGAAVVVDPTGDVIVSGVCTCGKRPHSEFVVVRMNGDGRPQHRFATRGVASIDIGSGTAGATALALDPTGRIVIGGQAFAHPPGDYLGWAVVRLTRTGRPDPSFSGDGKATDDIGFTSAGPIGLEGLTTDGSGSVIAVGEVAGPANTDFEVRRYLP